RGTRATESDLQRLDDAEQAFKREDYRAAESTFREEAKKFPESTDLRLNLALTLMLLDRANDAVALLRSTLGALDAADARARMLRANLAQAFLASGRPDSAAVVAAMELNDPIAANASGVVAYLNGDYAQAADRFRVASAHGSGLPTQQLNLAT